VRLRRLLSLPVILSLLVGCGDAASSLDGGSVDAPAVDVSPPDAPEGDASNAPSDGCAALGAGCDGGARLPGLTEMRFTVTIGPNGVSAPVDFIVPANARSITVVVDASPDTLVALASLRTADGVERVGLDPTASPGPAMAASYHMEQVGQMPGGLYQSIRLGAFTQVYPYRPDQPLPAGTMHLRVASDATSGQATVRIFVAPEDGSRVLHLNVIAVSDTLCFGVPPSFLAQMQAIFDQAGIGLVVDAVATLPGSGLNRLTTLTEPQEGPRSQAADLARLARSRLCSSALNLFVVDAMPSGVGGLSLGTPGPTDPGSDYWGVVIRRASTEATLARVAAHEVAHFLGLQHVQNVGVSGRVYPDPLDDTAPDPMNLMERGIHLTADQGYTLSRSALLRTR
jgi:hypothetical protein